MHPSGDQEFRSALGVRRDLRFRVAPPGEASYDFSLGSACAVIGRAAEAQFLIPRATVSYRHAYLQAIGNRVFVADLFGANSVAWYDGVASGWASPRRPFRIGDCRVELFEDGWDEAGAALSPFDHKLREDNGHEYGVLPEVELQVLNRSLDGIRWPINRVITLVGRDDRCRITCNDQFVSKVHCSLVLTPSGLWAVDLLGKGGTLVDETPIQTAPLRPGSVLQVGRFQMQINYLSPAAAPPPPKAEHVAFLTRLHRIFSVAWDGDTLIVTPQGRSRDFRYQDIQLEANCIIQILRTQSFRNVLVDFHLVRLSGSLIIDALTQFCRAAQGVGAICECSPEQLQSLQDMNLLSLWPYYPTRAEAVRALRVASASQPAEG